MRWIENIVYIVGLCLFCLALKAQNIDYCFDSSHFVSKKSQIILDKSCWQSIGFEYNRMSYEIETLFPLYTSCKNENSFWSIKYASINTLHTHTKLLLDSTSKIVQKQNETLDRQNNAIDKLQTQLLTARKNHAWYAGGGFVASVILSLVAETIIHNND